jgi:hypothetical protein
MAQTLYMRPRTKRNKIRDREFDHRANVRTTLKLLINNSGYSSIRAGAKDGFAFEDEDVGAGTVRGWVNITHIE